MRMTMLALFFFGLRLCSGVAADQPKVEVYVGYQYTRFSGANANGWEAAVTGNVNSWLGVKADFSGMYSYFIHDHTYMFGPVLSARSERFTPFVQALFGGASFAGNNAFAMALGGGVNAKVNRNFGFRLFQADWLVFRENGFTFRRNGRISAGLVFQF